MDVTNIYATIYYKELGLTLTETTTIKPIGKHS